MNEDLKLAYDTIISKRITYTTYWRYYLGDQPLVYANERLEDVFAGVQAKFIENWCGVVVDSLKERLQLVGFSVPEQAQSTLDEIWEDNELDIETDDLHEGALVAGEAFLIVWPDEDGRPEMYYNDPRLVAVFYESDRPREPRYAAKLWQGDDGYARMTLYYPDRLEYYTSKTKGIDVSSAAAFTLESQAANPYDVIPVFHFRPRRQVISEIYDITPIQNGINKLLTDMMVAAEYGAFRQRYIISNSDVNQLKNAPNEIWSIPAGDGIGQQTSVGEFSTTDLGNYLAAVEHLAGAIAKITRMPKTYFYTQGGDPSGEALIAMESGLSRKAQNRQERLSVAWKKAIQFALLLAGKTVELSEIEPVWDAVETIQPKTEAEIRALDVQTGIPLKTVLRRDGWTDQELDDMEADRESSGAEMADRLLSAFEKGQEDNAIQKQTTASVPVGETSQNSSQVGA